MMTRTSSSRLPEPSAWNSALCSESAGRMQAPAFCARCMKKSPAQTRHSLLASATVAPRSTAASAGFRPAAPLTAAITQSAGRAAASMIALSPAPHSMPRAGQRLASDSVERLRIGHRDKARDRTPLRAWPAPEHCCCRSAPRPGSGRAQPRSRSMVLSPIEPVAPSTVDAAHGRRTRPCCYAKGLRSCFTKP